MKFLQADTPLPPFLPYPRFLLKLPLNETARLVYILLLSRAQCSQANNWVDEEGRVYLYYTVEELARDCGKGQTVVKQALSDLCRAQLVVRRRAGRNGANRYCLCLPPDSGLSSRGTAHCGQASVRQMDRQLSAKQTVSCPPDRQHTVPGTVGKPTRNKNKRNTIHSNDSE